MVEQYLSNVWRVGGGSWSAGVATLSVERDGNVYLLKGEGDAALVDSGRTLASIPPVESNIAEVGVEPEDIKDIILTHSHCDHSGAAGRWQSQRGACVHLNAVGADFLARGDKRLVGVPGPESEFTPFKVDHAIRDGEAFAVSGIELRPTFTPGHTPDSMLLVVEMDGRRAGFCGDVCFGPDGRGELGGVGWLCVLWESNLRHYRASLASMLDMNLDVLLPGHGFILDGADKVREVISASLDTVERLIAEPLVRHFGMMVD